MKVLFASFHPFSNRREALGHFALRPTPVGAVGPMVFVLWMAASAASIIFTVVFLADFK